MEENRIMEEEPLLRKIIKKHMVVSGDDSEQNHVTMLNIGNLNENTCSLVDFEARKYWIIFLFVIVPLIDFLSWTSKFLNVLKMGDILTYTLDIFLKAVEPFHSRNT